MGNVDVILKDCMQIDGALGAALVGYETGMSLGQSGGSGLSERGRLPAVFPAPAA